MDTAMIVIDMQNGFCHPRGSLPRVGMALPRTAEVIAANVDLVAAARAAGVPIIFTRHVFRPDRSDIPVSLAPLLPDDPGHLARGSWDAEVVDELLPLDGDKIVDKNRFDAFLYTDLELVLRTMGVRRLLVTGLLTNVCVESTVRSAQQRDFAPFVAADCTAARGDAHEAALKAMVPHFAQIGTGRELLAQLLESVVV